VQIVVSCMLDSLLGLQRPESGLSALFYYGFIWGAMLESAHEIEVDSSISSIGEGGAIEHESRVDRNE